MRVVTPERQQLKEEAQRLGRRGLSGSDVARRLEIPERTARRYMTGHNTTPNVADKMAVHYSSAAAEWTTPKDIINRVLEVMGAIDLDARAGESRTVPAEHRFTQADGGLDQDWHVRVYMNPPYARDIGR